MMQEAVIVSACRTAIGKFDGSLAGVAAPRLGALVVSEALSRAKVDAAQVDDVILGQVLTGASGQNPARQAAMFAKVPQEVPAMTVNHVCGSGLRSVHLAATAIWAGQADAIVCGGQENMSAAPHAIPGSRRGFRLGDAALVDMMVLDGLTDVFNNCHMGVTAENVAEMHRVSREAQDAFACASQNKTEAAQKAGKFRDEIVPVQIPQRKGDPVVFDEDEFPRHGATVESLAKLRPAFKKDGTVTAANSSGINDGAAALVVVSGAFAERNKLTPLAVVRAGAFCGLDPAIMGMGPVSASRKCLERAGWKAADVDLLEINEAFAAQALAVNAEMGWDESRVNVNGGAIALGHPIGASGARILVTLLHEMGRRDAKRGLASLCIGGGQGIALAVERA